MSSRERQRGYARKCVRRKSARRYAAERSTLERCPRKAGPYPCGGLLEIEIDREGRTFSWCPWCERRAAGICQDCPRPVDGQVRKALRCAACKLRKKREIRRTYWARHAEELRPIERDRQRAYRAAHPGLAAEVARRWRQRHPDRARAVHERWVRKNAGRLKVLRRRWRRNHKRRALEVAA